jgi:hypothetical protein
VAYVEYGIIWLFEEVKQFDDVLDEEQAPEICAEMTESRIRCRAIQYFSLFGAVEPWRDTGSFSYTFNILYLSEFV